MTLAMHLRMPPSTPLTVVLTGPAVAGRGVAVLGHRRLGDRTAARSSASTGAPSPLAAGDAARPSDPVVQLQIDQQTGALSGTVQRHRPGRDR